MARRLGGRRWRRHGHCGRGRQGRRGGGDDLRRALDLKAAIGGLRVDPHRRERYSTGIPPGRSPPPRGKDGYRCGRPARGGHPERGGDATSATTTRCVTAVTGGGRRRFGAARGADQAIDHSRGWCGICLRGPPIPGISQARRRPNGTVRLKPTSPFWGRVNLTRLYVRQLDRRRAEVRVRATGAVERGPPDGAPGAIEGRHGEPEPSPIHPVRGRAPRGRAVPLPVRSAGREARSPASPRRAAGRRATARCRGSSA